MPLGCSIVHVSLCLSDLMLKGNTAYFCLCWCQYLCRCLISCKWMWFVCTLWHRFLWCPAFVFWASSLLNWDLVYTVDYEVGPWKMAFFLGPISWSTFIVRFLEKPTYKAFGPLTRWKPNVDQEEWPCIKKWMCSFFLIYAPKKVILEKFKFNYSLVFIFSSPKTFH